MRRRIIYLLYRKAYPIDRKEFMEKYSNTAQSKFASSATYTMLKGTPILINIEGTLIEATTLPEILKNRRDADEVNKFVSCLKQNKPEINLPSQLQFRWSFN
jgi:hypothetical protein